MPAGRVKWSRGPDPAHGPYVAQVWVRAFALEAGRLGSILSRVKPKTIKLVSAVTLAKRSAIKCSAEAKGPQ